jgi:mono/diheme cytochrome c family protein
MIRLPRFARPPGPILGAATMSGLALMLIAVIVARSPYTHANLSPEGYHRTDIAYVGQEYPLPWLRLADPRLARTGDPAQDGRLLFTEYGCTSCHGLTGQGGAVGKEISGDSALKISSKVREGPKNMPAFSTSVLSDSDLQKLIAFLQSIKH